MEREEALTRIPPEYAAGLRLADAGAQPEAIAEALHIDLTAIDAVIRIGRAKLAALTGSLVEDLTSPPE